MKYHLVLTLAVAVLLGVTGLELAPVAQAETPTVGYSIARTLTLASTEYRIALTQGVKAFSVQCRGAYDLRLAFAAGGTTSNYRTIKANVAPVYYSPPVAWNGVIYLRCEQAGQVAEIEYWQ